MTAPAKTRDVFDYLKFCISQAQSGQRDLMNNPITYREVGTGAHIFSAYVSNRLGNIRDHFCKPRRIPLINFLVVSKKTGIPGELAGHPYEGLSREAKRRVWTEEMNRILAYDWRNVEFIED